MSGFFNKVKIFFGFEEDFSDTPQDGISEKPIPEPKTPVIRGFKGTLVNSHNAHKFTMSEIKVIEPRIYEDSLTIATYLRENKPALVNLKYLDKIASKRLIDFVCGTAYAINGHMMKIGEHIFLFTPENIHIAEADDKTPLQQGLEQEEKEVFFKRAAL